MTKWRNLEQKPNSFFLWVQQPEGHSASQYAQHHCGWKKKKREANGNYKVHLGPE